ncbi:PAAR motif protein [Photorhabdus khanii NC19]|uniref:PAAR motif protein n=1 Tax=Photorhabdus khanii NC19 TaxID=1004151 RepID=W3V1F5_9GAMM|nr:S-type pyocin domain-containing protein [Photorhabdus khanii]ETS29623.1 PAAR motif protein [Photorhabdus khanii NC19]
MLRSVVREGDATSHGGKVLAGEESLKILGKRVARIGDPVSCPKCGGNQTIIEGTPGVKCPDDQMVALEGMKTSCGATLIASQALFQVEDGGVSQFIAGYAETNTQTPTAAAAPQATAITENNARPMTPVFTKSCLRSEGCTDAGTNSEPVGNFGQTAFYQAAASVPVSAGGTAASGETGLAVMRFIGGTLASAGRWLVSTSPLGVGVMGILYSPKLNEGESDYLDSRLLETLAKQHGTAPTRVRFRWETDANTGKLIPRGYHTSPDGGFDQVPVRMMTLNSATGHYEFWQPGENRPTILWTPNEQEFKVPSHTGNEEEPFIPSQITVLPLPDKVGSDIESLPMPEEKGFRDYILVFPADSGIKPIYVMFNTPRNQPGIVTGQGQKIEGNWLSSAGQGMGAPIPSQIADKLRGRTFNNFDDFRKAFWKEVGNDTELSKQFIISNYERMKVGKAAKSRRIDAVGKRSSFELHHVKSLKDGGSVYDLDNLQVVTPKRHIEIHSNK